MPYAKVGVRFCLYSVWLFLEIKGALWGEGDTHLDDLLQLPPQGPPSSTGVGFQWDFNRAEVIATHMMVLIYVVATLGAQP